MNPVEKMNLYAENFTKTECVIYNYILSNPSQVVHGSIYDLAEWIGVSRSAILRFAQKIGYNGFSEFKYDFSRYVHGGGFHVLTPNESRMTEIVQIYQKTIGLMTETLSEQQLDQLVDQMLAARRIKIFGLNRTGLSAIQLRQRFHKINFDGEAVTDYILIPEIANQGNEQDVHIYFSTQGVTPIILEAIQASKKKNVFTVLVTMNNHSKMIQYADMVFYLPSTKPVSSDYFFDLQPINMVFIEILLAYLGEKLAQKNAARLLCCIF